MKTNILGIKSIVEILGAIPFVFLKLQSFFVEKTSKNARKSLIWLKMAKNGLKTYIQISKKLIEVLTSNFDRILFI